MEGRALPLQKIGSFSYIDSSIILGGNSDDFRRKSSTAASGHS